MGRRNTLYPCKIIDFIDLANVRCTEIAEYQNMRRIWNNYKVWILIGIAYTGFYFFKGYKNLKKIISSLQPKIIYLFRP